MKKGDTVRFLNETGGGKITGFSGKDIVLVEDQDGFEIPFRINEVVVIDSNDHGSARMTALNINQAAMDKEGNAIHNDQRSIKAMLNAEQNEPAFDETDGNESFDTPDDTREVTFQAPVEERKGGNRLTAYVAFVPSDSTLPADTTFDIYLVNDCNYFLQLSYMTEENDSWTLAFQGELAPNTMELVATLTYADLAELNRLVVQGIAYKREKSFLLKPTLSVCIKLDATKCYKQSTFRDSDFFDTPAWLHAIVVDDEPVKALQVDAGHLAKAMLTKRQDDRHVTAGRAATVPRSNDPLVVDLHIDTLLDSIQGMTSKDILDYQLQVFKDTLEANRKHRGQKIVFIHGKGEGVLRRALIHALNYQYKKFTYQDASFREYGYGATQVTIH